MQETFKQVDKFIVSNKLLGEGQFGKVYRGFFKDDLHRVVAVKVIPLQHVSKDAKFIKLLKNEIEILMKVKNTYVVGMFHATRTAHNLYMFLEYCDEGDLKKLLKQRNGRLTESEAVIYFRQICEGFRALYNKNIIHRDIKPANIMIKEGKAMISDFGFSKCLDNCGMEEAVKQTYLGTPLYMAPQILNEETFSSKCDIWSLGMLFYEILYGKTPWTGQTPYKLHKNIMNNPVVTFPDYPITSDLVKDMIKKMLVTEEKDRMSWPDLLEHPLIKLDFDEVQKKINEINSNNETDPLLRSVELNQFYCNKNKVMGLDKQQQLKAFKQQQEQSQDSQKNDESQSVQEKQSQQLQEGQNTQEIDIASVLKQQEEQNVLKKVATKIDSYITFQRNVGIFINLTTNYIFRLHQNQVIAMPQHLFFRIIFVLQKKQLIGFQHLLGLMGGSIPADNNLYNPQELEYYQKLDSFKQTLQVIQNDNGYVRPYFEQIFGKTKSFLEKYAEETEIQEFFKILNEDMSINNQDFEQVYNNTLDEFLYIIKSNLPEVTEKKRDLIQYTFYVYICKNPYQAFKWASDEDNNSIFHQFYDKYDNMAQEELLEELKNTFKFEVE